MQIIELEIEAANAAGMALTLVATFGSLAGQLTREQAENCADRPDLAARWRGIADAVDTLVRANQHMELALDLLDTIGETSVPPLFDSAIATMGIRKPDVCPPAIGLGIKSLDARYLYQRTVHHLQLAEAEQEVDGKAAHLNAAARYATLREFALRDDGDAAVPTIQPDTANSSEAGPIQA